MGLRLRAGTIADVETFARLVNTQHQWLRGEDLWAIDELSSILISPTSDPVRYDRYVEVDGEVVAGLHTHTSPPYEKGSLYVAAPPGPNRVDNVRYLLDSGLRLLRSRPEMRGTATILLDLPVEDTELMDLAQSMGFTRANRVAIMEATVTDSPDPAWPANAEAKALDPATDLSSAYGILAKWFETEPSWWHLDEGDFFYAALNDPTARPDLSSLITVGGEPAGMVFCYEDTTRADTGLIGNLAVIPKFQGQGIGTALLLDAFGKFRSCGWTHARLATISGYHSREPSVFREVGMEPIFFNEIFLRPLDW